jgi:hypothetical protein
MIVSPANRTFTSKGQVSLAELALLFVKLGQRRLAGLRLTSP